METTLKSLERLTLLAIVATSLFLASCNKDEDPAPVSPIVGKWTIQSLEMDLVIEGGQSLADFLKDLGYTDEQAELTEKYLGNSINDTSIDSVEFKEDGTWVSSGMLTLSSGTWELSADEKTLTLDKGTADERIATVVTLTATDLALISDFANENMQGLSWHIELVLTR